MRHLVATLLVALFALSAAAQEADTAAARRIRPEFTFRANAEFLDGSLNLTGGIRTPGNNVFGLGAGWGQQFFILGPESANPWGQRISLFAYYRHYFPLGQKKVVSLYTDFMLGGTYVYKMCDWYHGYQREPGQEPEYPVNAGSMYWWPSFQPGIAFNLWGKSNFFIGLSIGPTFGLHAGLTL